MPPTANEPVTFQPLQGADPANLASVQGQPLVFIFRSNVYHDNGRSVLSLFSYPVNFTIARSTCIILSQANNMKFKGYLLGMLGKYPEAKNAVQPAIKFYTLKNAFYGVAVSQFDLSRVCDQENQLDSAIYCCTLSLNFWKVKNNTWRIFNVQTMLIHLLTKSAQYDKAKAIQIDCEKLIGNKEIRPTDLIDFYIVLEISIRHRIKRISRKHTNTH